MTEEVFLSGFCKAQNQPRTVMCEFEPDADGGESFVDSDCAFPECPHSGSCMVFRDIQKNRAKKTGEKKQ